MALSKYDSMWKFMSNNHFIFHPETGDEDFRCAICKEVMVNAVLNNVCGCHYCYECITNGENIYCPGTKEDCKEEKIMFGSNVVRNVLLNKGISKLRAKCPNQSCECYVDLIEMEDHLRLCTKQPVECPYSLIGCTNEKTSKEAILTHLHCEEMSHAGLLMELMINLKNEVCGLKDDFAKSKSEVDFLKEKLIDKEEIMVKQKKESEINEQRQNEEIENLRIAVSDLTKEVKEGVEKNLLEISSLKEKLSKKENLIDNLEGELRKMKTEVESKVSGERSERKKELTEQRRVIEDVRLIGENAVTMVNDVRKDLDIILEERKMDGGNKSDNCYSNIEADFVWKIEEVSTKLGKDMWSESFYWNGYSLYLNLVILSNDNVGLYCWISKGDNDNILVWPLKRVVTLSIIDQVTLRAHKSQRLQSAFNKPNNNSGGFVGNEAFIKYASIKDKSSIVVNDSVIVTCVISEQ